MSDDPAEPYFRAEARFPHPAPPGVLRKMAESAREVARSYEDSAGRAYNRADFYDDLATRREQERTGTSS